MSEAQFTRQVLAFNQWKKDIIREAVRFRTWLNEHHLMTDDLKEQIEDALQQLISDQITVAFAGEFSRGKTELINALFFSQYGRRVLPSTIGRTTMCPTELFYDRRLDKSYIRLLPVETRASNVSIDSFKRLPDKWKHIDLDANDPDAMTKAFAEVAATKIVSADVAAKYGFDVEALEPAADGRFSIPAWRHALISFRHPLLQEGLNIVDTPGLNALGYEPELTLSLLPEAQAIIFLLSADTGVTATDLEIWKEHISHLGGRLHRGLFVVINKIDLVWGDIQGEEHVLQSIEKIRRLSAKQLGVEPENVIALSAKMGLKAKMDRDMALLSHSCLDQLEDLIASGIIAEKERLLQATLVRSLFGLIQDARDAVGSRVESMREQKKAIADNIADSQSELVALTRRTKQEQQFFQRAQIVLKSGRALIENRLPVLLSCVAPERLREHYGNAKNTMDRSWTANGVNEAIDSFFAALEQDLQKLDSEAKNMTREIQKFYTDCRAEGLIGDMKVPEFTAKEQLEALEQLHSQSGRYQLRLTRLASGQGKEGVRFFNALAEKARDIYVAAGRNGQHWCKDALNPVIQKAVARRNLLGEQMQQLATLSQAGQTGQQRLAEAHRMLEELEHQYGMLDQSLEILKRPAPQLTSNRIVTLA
ncbi:MAG: dynamin family protein [Pseudomonadota bacterium]